MDVISSQFTIHGRQDMEDEDSADDESEVADDESFASVDDLEGLYSLSIYQLDLSHKI